MGTFHSHKGPLHGITVVVDTKDSTLYIGRCDEQTPEGVVLFDVDVHDRDSELSREDYLERARKFGVFKKHARFVVPAAMVESVNPLGAQ